MKDFATEPVSPPSEEVREFIHKSVSLTDQRAPADWARISQADNHRHTIPIVDAVIAHQVKDTDIVSLISRSVALLRPSDSHTVRPI